MRIDLNRDAKGKPLVTIENFLSIIDEDPTFIGLKFNQLTQSPETLENGQYRRWTDADDSKTREYIEHYYGIHNPSKLDDALRIMFNKEQYHPIKEALKLILWDGKARIEGFLHRWMCCEDTPYTREVSRLIFSGGINRLFENGCKFDDVPVLIGTHQGEGKSTFVRWLAMEDDFFREVTDIEGQRGMESLEGAWICEVAELLALTRTKEIEAVKSYITRQVDKYRMPYDKRVTEHKRQCVFIGTTNKEQFLTDKTGNRRFYPVKVNQKGKYLFKYEKQIKEEIRQCWAEAKYRYSQGKMLPHANFDLVEDIKTHQNKAVEDDYREGMIQDYLADKNETCVLQLWQYALKNEYSKPSRKDSNDITLILQSMNQWKNTGIAKRFVNFGVQKVWVRK